MDNIYDFLIELSKLSTKHNIAIHGCGCCGSPFLGDKSGIIATDLTWESEKQQYKVRDRDDFEF